MHKAHHDHDGSPRCRTCGSDALLARSNERNKRIQHLKCANCGTRQRYRGRKLAV
jgi:transcription elongation factor Elf1